MPSEFPGGYSEFFLKDPVKIGQIVKPRIPCNG